ncbi:hypothetical protein [Lysobacter antibioticus]|uniref:hypothetical protein n=1 Tax=Lysobacter antibioticus TaxID=84531 RepID=UPI001F1BAB43|nr:hypothetical protein [Lysobacter antibioticus]
MKNKIEDLRNHLFAVIEGLSDPDNPMEIDRAIAIANVAQVLINSAKVEVEFMRVTDSVRGSGFIPSDAGTATCRPAIDSKSVSYVTAVTTPSATAAAGSKV